MLYAHYKSISKTVTGTNSSFLTIDSRQQVILFNFFEYLDQATLKKAELKNLIKCYLFWLH